MPGYSQLLSCQHAAGTAFASYTTAKSVINPQAVCVIPGNFLRIGDYLRIRASGGLSNVITTQCQFTFSVQMGPAIPTTIVVHTSQALLTTNVAHTLIPFEYEVVMRLDSEGSGTTAKFLSQGMVSGIMFPISGNVADPTASIGAVMAPATAPAVGTGFDSTVANYLDFYVGIQTSAAGNGIQIYQYTVELLSDRN